VFVVVVFADVVLFSRALYAAGTAALCWKCSGPLRFLATGKKGEVVQILYRHD
jgi:hypothetical protein